MPSANKRRSQQLEEPEVSEMCRSMGMLHQLPKHSAAGNTPVLGQLRQRDRARRQPLDSVEHLRVVPVFVGKFRVFLLVCFYSCSVVVSSRFLFGDLPRSKLVAGGCPVPRASRSHGESPHRCDDHAEPRVLVFLRVVGHPPASGRRQASPVRRPWLAQSQPRGLALLGSGCVSRGW